ncbi:hypothetical protein Zmor_024977 [Zophobas morio]|uniref:Uncharacterized protein n=1 Tax=Zophobas morio TaxID=2755281 RepID=A0AA38HQL2_9CUCU|nr:hypothetical protein Zmor_024977 [Zophobas morio]
MLGRPHIYIGSILGERNRRFVAQPMLFASLFSKAVNNTLLLKISRSPRCRGKVGPRETEKPIGTVRSRHDPRHGPSSDRCVYQNRRCDGGKISARMKRDFSDQKIP